MQQLTLDPPQPESENGLHLVPAPPAQARRPRSQIWIARLIQIIFCTNLLIIIGLWAKGGNITAVHTEAALLTSVGRITGLLASYFLLVQVLLLARLPFLKALAGFDRLTVWHRWNGRFTVLFILAHVGFITAGYALADRLSVTGEVVSLLTNYPGMVQALLGTVLLLLVGVTSAVIVRRRLRYETWYAVHLMAYLGIFLAWFHQIPTGNEFVLNPVAAAYWTALYIVTLQLVVVFRVVQPLLRGLWHGMRVAEVIPEGPGVVSLRITGRRLDWMDVHAGQFFLWRFLAPGMWRESHPFSLSASPQGNSLRITVKELGDFSTRLGLIKPGTRVMAEGPFGSFTSQARQHEGAVLIAAGIGITPVRALLEEMTGDLTLIYRAVKDDDLIFRHELDALVRHGVRVHYVIGDHRLPEHRHLLSGPHLRQLVPDIANCDIYLCGPSAMMRSLQRTLRRVGVAKASIHTDEFAF
jgi:predicted ferric reductase